MLNHILLNFISLYCGNRIIMQYKVLNIDDNRKPRKLRETDAAYEQIRTLHCIASIMEITDLQIQIQDFKLRFALLQIALTSSLNQQ